MRSFLRDLVGFYVIREGIFFYAEFATILGLKRQNKMVGIGQQSAVYVEHVPDRRIEQLDLETRYCTDNPFPWMSERVDLNKEKNFFETQVTDYQSGGSLDW
jgi:ribonucleotide reductase beta subunit family protein with ferritin-like domain